MSFDQNGRCARSRSELSRNGKADSTGSNDLYTKKKTTRQPFSPIEI
jgi:hypothetical protein